MRQRFGRREHSFPGEVETGEKVAPLAARAGGEQQLELAAHGRTRLVLTRAPGAFVDRGAEALPMSRLERREGHEAAIERAIQVIAVPGAGERQRVPRYVEVALVRRYPHMWW